MIVAEDAAGTIFKWCCNRLGLPAVSDLRLIAEQRADLSIAGAVGYTSWHEDSVFMHVVLDTPHALSRDLLREAFVYPFVTQGKLRVYGMTPITAPRVLAFMHSLGFVAVMRTPDFILQVMAREDCRWINASQYASAKSDRNGTAAGSDPAVPEYIPASSTRH